MRRPGLLLLLCASACGSSVPSSAPTPLPAPEAERAEASPPVAETETETAPLPFSLEWVWAGAPESLDTIDPGGLTCRFVGTPARSTLECIETRSGERRWGLDIRDGSTTATLLREGDTLYVARYPRAGFGAIVERYSLDHGERRFRVALDGLVVPVGGLVSQSIELTQEDTRLVVRGEDAGGRWAVAIDRETGEVLGERVFETSGAATSASSVLTPPRPAPPPVATELPWQWDGPALYELDRVSDEVSIDTPDGGRCRWAVDPHGRSSDDGRALLECLDAAGVRTWGLDDARPFTDMEGRALAIDDGTLFVLEFHRMRTGASMTAYELATGVERWHVGLTGIGPVSHSRWTAWAQLRMSEGRPVVYGWESATRYVEMIDPVSGATVAHRIVPDDE